MKIGMVASWGSLGEVLHMAEEAEAHGWDGFFTWDGMSIGDAPLWDPWVLLGAAAQRTRTVTLGAMVFALPRRRPWKVAREAVTVDHLSGGRLVVPVGLGGTDDRGFSGVVGEAQTLRDRAARLDDALAVLDAAWSGEEFSYDGATLAVRSLRILPRPVQQPRIPIWVVGGWPSRRSMGRAARWDGVVLQEIGTEVPPGPEFVAEAATWVRGERARLGLDGPFDVVAQGRTPDDPAQARALLARYAEAGATWWVESRWDIDTDTPASLLAALRAGPATLT